MKKIRSLKGKNQKPFETAGNHWRIHALVFFVVAGACVILIRLYVLQVVAFQKYGDIAENQHMLSEEISPDRGEIYLKDTSNPYPLAVNRQLFLAYVAPKEVGDADAVIRDLSDILQVDRGMIAEKMNHKESMFEVIKKKLSDEEVERVKGLTHKGIHLIPETYRYYPGGELASQVVGFMGFDKDKVVGRYGMEAYWESELRGSFGSVVQEKDAGGRWIPIVDRDVTPAENGDSLVLTMSREVQYEVEKRLKDAVSEFQAESGTVVVMDPNTGRILSMASYPQFNPNEYSKVEDIGLFMNPAVSQPYESGSVMKAITEAIGLEDGKILPDSTYVDTGSVTEGGFTIHNSEDKVYGLQTMTNALEESINTGMIHIEKLVGNKKFLDYFKRFGFGEKTGIELPAELGGNIRNLSDLRNNVQFYTASFGQGVTVTPIQLVSAYSVLANGGKLMKPRIVEKIIHADGSEEEVLPQEVRRVVSEDTAKKMGVMLRSVVTNGHGKKADVPGYVVGGKTGTAQVAKTGSLGYEEGMNIGSFVGYAPINDPKFVVLVKMVNPKGVQWAESSAAPTFQKVMKFLLENAKIQPTESVEAKH
ncbi:MAG: penicillin-binding protein 2 [Candidatus Moranbacteria bacterium]|nr:penicillin-binding protein 2 [Candidatus Moranbacteria bacterium]